LGRAAAAVTGHSLDEAREWFDVLPDAMGIEDLVVRGAATGYAGGQRGWVKVNSVGVRCVRWPCAGEFRLVSALCGVR
jgi:hypothetical protein